MRQLDASVVDDLRQTIEDLNSSLYFYNKFNELWATLKVQDRSLSKDSEGKIRNLSWLIFIIARGMPFLASSDSPPAKKDEEPR